MPQEEIEQVARRMGLEKALREYPQAIERAASRLTDYAASLPAGWTPTTDPV
jgi:hypothetical protein